MRGGSFTARTSFAEILGRGSAAIARFRGRRTPGHLGPAVLAALLIGLFLPPAVHAGDRLADQPPKPTGLQTLAKSGMIAASRPTSNGRPRTRRPMTLCTRVIPGNAAGHGDLFRDLPRTDCLLLQSLGLKPDGTLRKDDTDEMRTFVGQVEERGDVPQLIPIIDNVAIANADPVGATRILRDASVQDRLAASILALSVEHGFSSAVLELFAIDSASGDMFGAMVERLAATLRAESISLGVALPLDAPASLKQAVIGSADFILLRAYGEHGAGTEPGPLASDIWFRVNVAAWARLNPVPSIILEFSGDGFEWNREDGTAEAMSFDRLLERSLEARTPIRFDRNRNAVSLGRDIWAQDGVVIYNQLAIAMSAGMKSFALNRLGSADPSAWETLQASVTAGEARHELLEPLSFAERYATLGEGAITQISGDESAGHRTVKMDPITRLATASVIDTLPERKVLHRWGSTSDKKLALTFDDGPSGYYTPLILDVLNRYGAKATFFVVGYNVLRNRHILGAIVEQGHEIGNHTFSHPQIDAISDIRLKAEMSATQRLIESATGLRTTLFRSPYNSGMKHWDDNTSKLDVISDQGYFSVETPIDPRDWESGATAQTIADNVIEGVRRGDGNVILMHDDGLDRSRTIEALPTIIQTLSSEGYSFVPLGGLVGGGSNVFMQPTSSGLADSLQPWIAGALGLAVKLGQALIILCIVLGLLRLALVMGLAARGDRGGQMQRPSRFHAGLVSVIVPAYNEEKVIVRTIDAILASDYPQIEVIVVDDGSKDATVATVYDKFKDHPGIKVIQKANGGKSSALNLGLNAARGRIVVALDADTLFQPDTISLLVENFADPRVAAVAGNAKVGNRINLLTRLQAVEYITAQNLERRAFETLNAISVVPGAIGAWRKSAIREVGKYSTATLAEDCDLTLSLIEAGYRIAFDERAIAYTEAPDTIAAFLRQRFRWSFGTLQNIWKHKRAAFSTKARGLGAVALPQMFVFQFLVAIIAPFVDLAVLYVLAYSTIDAAVGRSVLLNSTLILTIQSYFLFLLVDILAAAAAYIEEPNEQKSLILLLPLQRFFYRQLLYFVALKSLVAAIQGTRVQWGAQQRKATVTFKGAMT